MNSKFTPFINYCQMYIHKSYYEVYLLGVVFSAYASLLNAVALAASSSETFPAFIVFSYRPIKY